MVTFFGPVNRVVSIRASIAVSSPGFREVFSALADTHPQETRTLKMVRSFLVLLTTRKLCFWVGPRGTEPKSLLSSSKRPSAQVAALAALATQRPARRTKLYRNMVLDPAPPPG